jgi:hypothetical protein
MTRITWLSAVSCAVLVAALGGCGGSSPAANKDGGSGGAAGTGADGAAGATGSGGTTGSGGATGTGGASGAGGSDAGTVVCQAGASCTGNQTCTSTMGCRQGTQDVCFCDPNGQFACQGCERGDAGTTTDAGNGLGTCPASASGMACSTVMFCQLTCADNTTEVCRCRAAGGNSDAGMAWQCFNACN